MEAAPQPPSLKLPDRITDLAAIRAGNQVTLTWTTPKRDTDKVMLNGDVTTVICRQENSNTCLPAGTISSAPGAKGAFSETLPPELASGQPRSLGYFIELKNHRGRSAGPSNVAIILAGEAPSPVTSLTAEPHKQGVALRWTAGPATQSVRLYRKLLSVPQKKEKTGPLAAPKQATEITLLVDSDTGRALDPAVEFTSEYEYRAQRVARLQIDGQTLELAGEISAPVHITVEDTFPPAIPTGLAAVATASPAAIDLSWLPVTDRNLAGYVVYRREGDTPWQRISPAQPVIGPAFHDTQVQPGHTYRYAITSISPTNHESPRSPETEETVPAP